MRIAKRIAHAGLCSRRDAEEWITAGRVSVNGETLTTPAFKVTQDDTIIVDGKQIAGGSIDTRLFLYHKAAGLVTTHKDDRDRRTLFDAIRETQSKDVPRLVSVGRLDLNTEGLILLTNDGELSRYLELPATGWSRKYRVRVNGRVNEKRLAALKAGITVEGIHYGSIEAKLEQPQKTANAWISMVLREGKNREIRRVMEALNLQVNRLIRVSYGPFNLGKLPRGELQEVPQEPMKAQLAKYFKDR